MVELACRLYGNSAQYENHILPCLPARLSGSPVDLPVIVRSNRNPSSLLHVPDDHRLVHVDTVGHLQEGEGQREWFLRLVTWVDIVTGRKYPHLISRNVERVQTGLGYLPTTISEELVSMVTWVKAMTGNLPQKRLNRAIRVWSIPVQSQHCPPRLPPELKTPEYE